MVDGDGESAGEGEEYAEVEDMGCAWNPYRKRVGKPSGVTKEATFVRR